MSISLHVSAYRIYPRSRDCCRHQWRGIIGLKLQESLIQLHPASCTPSFTTNRYRLCYQCTMSPVKPSNLLPTRAPGPLQAFIDGYPHQRTSPSQNHNLEFYTLARKCQPDNLDLRQMRAKLSGDMEECEHNHGWVQWRVYRSSVPHNPLEQYPFPLRRLFPIRAQGVNPSAQPLQPHEITQLLSKPGIQDSLIDSYKIWLKFLGLRLVDRQTGLLGRDERGFAARTKNFRQNSHNLLRVSRVMQWLSEFQMEQHSESFLLCLLAERKAYGWSISSSGRASAFADSVMRYYMWCFRDPSRRDKVRSVLQGILEHELSAGDQDWTADKYKAYLANSERS